MRQGGGVAQRVEPGLIPARGGELLALEPAQGDELLEPAADAPLAGAQGLGRLGAGLPDPLDTADRLAAPQGQAVPDVAVESSRALAGIGGVGAELSFHAGSWLVCANDPRRAYTQQAPRKASRRPPWLVPAGTQKPPATTGGFFIGGVTLATINATQHPQAGTLGALLECPWG
jgi:hypothetical protein